MHELVIRGIVGSWATYTGVLCDPRAPPSLPVDLEDRGQPWPDRVAPTAAPGQSEQSLLRTWVHSVHQGQSSSTTVPLATMPKEAERHNYAGIEKQRDHQEAFGGHQHITSEHSLLHSLAGTFSPFNR